MALAEVFVGEKAIQEFVTVRQAANHLTVSRRWVTVLCERGTLLSLEVGGVRLVWWGSVQKYQRDKAAGLTARRGRPKKEAA
jgi:hypothetical protein